MVVFACNHCGESLKKQVVDKHYLTKCRGAPVFISCMDCQKDFKGDYTEHIKCITEAEKYSGKDYQPRAAQNKGERKQQAWTDLVRNVIQDKSANLKPDIRDILTRLANYDNVPRKQQKFKNFLKNSMRLRFGQDEVIWKLLEESIAKEQINSSVAAQQNGQNGNDANKRKQDEIEEETAQTNGNAKKKKRVEENGIDETELAAVETVVAASFSWEDTIKAVLAKKSNTIKLDKLRKKCINKYIKFKAPEENEDGAQEKLGKKFLKKLKKISGVSVGDDEYVTLTNE